MKGLDTTSAADYGFPGDNVKPPRPEGRGFSQQKRRNSPMLLCEVAMLLRYEARAGEGG